MSRYWIVAPYNSAAPQIFDKAWEYDLQNGTIAIGWTELGDFSNLSKAELKSKYIETYGDNYAKNTVAKDINALWRFYHEMLPGDVVIARRGTKKIIGVGTITGAPYYDLEKGKERLANLTDSVLANFIPIKFNNLQRC
jgi:5-methylcytosine-specific restriction protein B